MPNAPGLAHDPWVQMQHHQPPGDGTIGVEAVEPPAPKPVDFVDMPPADSPGKSVDAEVEEDEFHNHAVLVEDDENENNSDPVAIFLVAPAADIRKLRLFAGPYPLRTAHRAHRHRCGGRHLPIPML